MGGQLQNQLAGYLLLSANVVYSVHVPEGKCWKWVAHEYHYP